MEGNAWDFNCGGTMSNAMNSIDTIGTIGEGGSMGCSIDNDQAALNVTFNTLPLMASGVQASRLSSMQGGLQGLDTQDSLGQLHAGSSMHFSSNHLLVAAKWFHQKKLQRALASSNAHTLATAHLHMDAHLWSPSHGTQETAKISLRRLLEGAAGANECPSVGSNGSKTSSPQQFSCDSLSSPLVPSMGNSPYFRESLCFPSGKEQTEHHNLFFQARPEFHEGMLDSFDGSLVQANQFRDAMWHSHPQVPRGVLVPSFPSHNGFNKPHDACEGVAGKTKPRVRARRGQATDPHSIAERLRRERIAERIKILQELVPNTNKTDRAIMLDEIIEYVKFLLLQVKVLSMSRLGSAGLVMPLAASLPEVKNMQTPTEVQGEGSGPSQDSMSAIEEHVARLITNNVGAALQFLQRKGLCLMPMSLAESSKPSTDASVSLANQNCSLLQSNSLSITALANKCPMQT
eukprot:c12443_g1_i1 orf=373-1752(+)